MKMQLTEIARALGVQVPEQWQEVTVTSVCFDSRQLKPGALFVPLLGETDGHNYLANAYEKGAAATLWQADHENYPTQLPALIVHDTLKALQRLGKYYLQKINPKVVAVTGSNGKTTTKDMIAAVLQEKYNVQKTYANFNNEIGVPLTCLSMEPNTEILVVEMGMDHFGQLDELSRLVEPDVAVITMIGEAHIEFFQTRARIADAKMEIIHGLKEDGWLIYNGDEPLLTSRCKQLDNQQATFGLSDTNTLWAKDIISQATQTHFKTAGWFEEEFMIPMIGQYNVNNALAALCVGRKFHVKPKEMQQALAKVSLTKNRTQWLTAFNDAKILNDVYNSNPTACKEVLRAFQEVNVAGKRLVVLGDMLELGDDAAKMHADLADEIDSAKISDVYLCGELMQNLGQALQAKFAPKAIHQYAKEDKAQLASELKDNLTSADAVMLKGSHGIHLEEIVAQLV